MQFAMKMIIEKQRTLARALAVRTKQLEVLQGGKNYGKGMGKLARIVRKHKNISAPNYMVFRATKLTRMQAAIREAKYEKAHLRRVLSVKMRELNTLKRKGLYLKTIARAKDTRMEDAISKLKSNNYNYGADKYPEACACQMLPPNNHSKCYYFADATETTCKYRQCKATFVCTNNDISGLVCMRRKKTSKLVVQKATTTAGLTQCSKVATSGYTYVPYTGR